MINFSPLAAEISSEVWAPQQISECFVSWLHYCTDVSQQRSSKLCTMFDRLLGWYPIYIYIFGRCGPQRNTVRCSSARFNFEFTLHPSLAFLILAALLHGTQAVGMSQTASWYKEWNYGTSARHLQQRAPRTFRGQPAR